jgi:hypothetical protein
MQTQQTTIRMIAIRRARPRTPPTTPPTIAPVAPAAASDSTEEEPVSEVAGVEEEVVAEVATGEEVGFPAEEAREVSVGTGGEAEVPGWVGESVVTTAVTAVAV